ncbi:MAG TPA: bifunctional class I SAM-dependent methyltransferase/glycosyltransferase family 2 protein [bacterium]|nr:bifunctional class I SAM-dependent methyltransferase/glycosyltransferase family 2 protein [bacterium]HPR87774.1 bifunctional class I SAM-dependent methyltransferase/glycosyltransferase family 2 protein [bacterium]
MNKQDLIRYYDDYAAQRGRWKKKNRYYHRCLARYFSFIIPANSRVLEIGCGTGELLAAVRPGYGVGVDFSPHMISKAQERFPGLTFRVDDAEILELNEKFDYVILSDLVGTLWDIQAALKNLRRVTHPRSRIVISYYSYLWEPLFRLAEKLGLKFRQPLQNWLSPLDMANLLELEELEIVREERKLLLPRNIPVLAFLCNRLIANLPLLNHLCMINLLVARPVAHPHAEATVTMVIPARNESGNIENAIQRIPRFGAGQEILFIEGHSSDDTYDRMLAVQQKYPERDIKVMRQSGSGKGNAVFEAFDAASGEVLMILDADLTTPPEDLPKFYHALMANRGEFINGCRLVYPMEKEAMRFLNLIANKLFSLFFSYLLGQPLKDTLCGTKVLFREDYQRIKQGRSYFGDFDPFGDFDLLFGAAKLNLRIVEVIVRYRDRAYGTTQISRFRHGLLLLRMSLFAARKIKFI